MQTGTNVGAKSTCSKGADASVKAGTQPGYARLTGGSKNKPGAKTK